MINRLEESTYSHDLRLKTENRYWKDMLVNIGLYHISFFYLTEDINVESLYFLVLFSFFLNLLCNGKVWLKE